MTEIPTEAKVQQDAIAKPPLVNASHEPLKRGSVAPELDPPEAPRQEDPPSVTEVGDSSTKPDREHDTRAKQDWVLLSEASISFAIDTSGSTLGSRLHHEQEAIRTVSSLLNDPARDAVRVLPWNSDAGAVTTLSGLSSLSSYGGTDPEALLNDGSSLTALQNSSCWFLLTDGEIPEISKVRFAKTLSSRGLHGTACVVIIFGEVYGRPTACNISVGVSVFAATPDCLFMFKDTQSDNCYLLQCKGTFSEILEQRNQLQPLLNDDTTWEDLPRISLKELSCVRIPDHRNLQADEIYFDSDLIVNLVDLLAGRISNKKVIDALLDNPSHLRTLTTTAQTRGMAEGLRQWVIKQELDPSELLASEVPEVEERGVSSMTSLMQHMRTPGSIAQDQQDIPRIQAELRASNSSYSYAINERWADAKNQSRQRSGTLDSILHRSYSDTNQAGSLSFLDDVEEKPIVKSNRPGRRVSSTGFVVSEGSAEAFEGACPLCAEQKTPLALLLREPPRTQTQNFPAVGSNSKLAFPLAMGNFRETDIIFPALYCDGCANTLVKTGSMVGEDKAIVSLTLVPYSGNKRAYDRLLKKAFQQRFDSNDAPMVFIAVLRMTLRRLESKDKVEEKPLCSALRWACRDLVQSVQCQVPLTWSTSGAPKGSKPLNEVLRDSAEAAVRSSSMDYFQYPIEGFVVMTDLLKDLAFTRPQLRNVAKKTVFQRLLFHVTEQFDKRVGTEGRVIMHLEMVRVLLLEQGRRDRALGARQFSSFRGLAGLTKSLFGERKSLANRLSLSFEELVAASLLDHEFLVAFKKLGPLADSVESQSGHAMAIFVHYLYRFETKSWPSSAAHYMALGKTPALASVLLEPFEISAGKAEGLIAKLPPWDTVGETPDHS